MSTPAGFGSLSSVQIGLESAYNTPVAATHLLGYVSSTLKPSFQATITDPTLNGSLVIANTYPKGKKISGRLRLILDYEGLNYIFDGAYGTATYGSQGGVDSGSGPNYVHTYTELKYLNSYTLQLSTGDIPAGKVHILSGCKIIGFEISIDQGGIAYLDLDILGATWNPNQNPTGALSAVTRIPAFFDDLSVVDDGSGDSTDIIGTSLKISMKSAVKERFALGSSTLLEPIRNGYVASEIQFVREFNSYSQITKFLAGTNVVPIFRFTNGSKYMEFRMGSGALVDVDQPVPGPDLLTQAIRISAKNTAGSPSYGLKAIIQNTQATALT